MTQLIRHLSINGKEAVGEAGRRSVVNPFDGTEVGSVTYASVAEASSAIELAHQAYLKVCKQPSSVRAEVLSTASRLLSIRKEEFAKLITLESGKPIDYARAEVDRAVYTFKIASEAATHARDGHVVDLSGASNGAGKQASYSFFPIGVVLAITPFNFPLNLVAHKLAPAIAAGNVIVLKPAPQTPLTAFLLSDVLVEAGLMSGALNVVPCENEIAEAMVRHPLTRMVSFTGSTVVGWKLKSLSGKARVTLELGGNGMTIIDEVDDIEKLVRSVSMAAFNYAGQVCIGLQNLLVHRKHYDRVVEALLAVASKLTVGDPKLSGTVVGPMISKGASEKVEKWISEAMAKGAVRFSGEYRAPNIITPTIMTHVDHSCDLWCEEAFAPILNIEAYDSFDDALATVNESRYGLQAGVFSKDRTNILKAFEVLEVGGVIVNETNNYRVDSMPYGGIKDSGFGREGVVYAMREMSEMKLLIE